MANKSALFKVNVMHEEKSSEPVYPVMRLESDRDIIAQVLGSTSELKESVPYPQTVAQEEKTEEMVK